VLRLEGLRLRPCLQSVNLGVLPRLCAVLRDGSRAHGKGAIVNTTRGSSRRTSIAGAAIGR